MITAILDIATAVQAVSIPPVPDLLAGAGLTTESLGERLYDALQYHSRKRFVAQAPDDLLVEIDWPACECDVQCENCLDWAVRSIDDMMMCAGCGADPCLGLGEDEEECPHCNGTGYRIREKREKR